jgi:hypothetical protein
VRCTRVLRVLLPKDGVHGRGLHSSTLPLNISAFCETGGAFRGFEVVFMGV